MPLSTSSSESVAAPRGGAAQAPPVVGALSPAKSAIWRHRFWRKLIVFAAAMFVIDHLLAGVLLRGLERNFGLDKPARVLLVGHSHTELGIDSQRLEEGLGVPVAKYALNGVNTFDRLAMIRQFLDRPEPAPDVVVYDVDAWTFTGEGLAQSSYKQFYPFVDEPSMEQYVDRCEDSKTQAMLRNLFKTLRYDDSLIWFSIRGYLGYRGNLKRGTVDLDRVRHDLAMGRSRPIQVSPENVKTFEETVQLVRSRGCKMVLLYIPTVDLLNEADPNRFQRVMRRFEEYAATDPGVIFLNYNRDLQSRHELFFDSIHMNPAGQTVVTDRLAGDLSPLLTGGPPQLSGPPTGGIEVPTPGAKVAG